LFFFRIDLQQCFFKHVPSLVEGLRTQALEQYDYAYLLCSPVVYVHHFVLLLVVAPGTFLGFNEPNW